MIEIVFGLIILALIGAFVLYVKETNAEKSKLINALISKTPENFRDLNLADRVRIKAVAPAEVQPDMVPLENLSEDEFDEHIKEQLK